MLTSSDRPLCSGIDEAGYGPLLGPLAIVRVSAIAPGHQAVADAFQAAGLGVRDSKLVYAHGRLAPLERIALAACAWLSGQEIDNAAQLFALVGETARERQLPWMHGAEQLRLPLQATAIPTWKIPSITPHGLAGSLIHPAELNQALEQGANKAEVEAQRIATLLAAIDAPQATSVVDRLGGRRYYQSVLARTHAPEDIAIEAEGRAESRYRIADRHTVRFLVQGDRHSALCSLAGCLAKYLREVHMHLFNQYWCGILRWLKPTAGYPLDARRWLHDIGSGSLGAWRTDLLRASARDATPH